MQKTQQLGYVLCMNALLNIPDLLQSFIVFCFSKNCVLATVY